MLMELGPGLAAISTLAVVYLLLSATINGAGHAFGYKGFDNDATNLRLLALTTFGEGLHDDHHARPAAAEALRVPRGIRPCVARDPASAKPYGSAKVTSKVDEGWDKHRRRIPPMATCFARTSTTDQPKSR